MIEKFRSFNCPYCGEELSISLDFTGGDKQSFVSDCEVCCKPIVITVTFDGEVVRSFSAEQENS